MGGPGDIGSVSAQGHLTYKLKLRSEELPGRFKLEAVRRDTINFRIDRDTPKKLYFDILHDEIVGPRYVERSGDRRAREAKREREGDIGGGG